MTFHSSGKFLITAEYLLLKGAVGLALPLKQGQVLTVEKNTSGLIEWKSKVFEETWFEATLDVFNMEVLASSDPDIATSLQLIFKQARILNPGFVDIGYDVTITADFNLAWGLGSSSTLINNMALWANVDPYILLEKTFGGSGYDIASAGAKGPLTYQLIPGGRIVKEVNFAPPFSEQIFFVYLGKKMNSRTGMRYFKEKAVYGEEEIDQINLITHEVIQSTTLSQFEELLSEHEKIMSAILQMPTIKESSFPDYPYVIKSMGAWGGDFVLVTGKDLSQVKKYFATKGLDTVIPYKDMVLS
jgi:mevalonate kinase